MAERPLPPELAPPIGFPLLGVPDVAGAMTKPEDELGRLSRALPLWLAEAFYFSPSYAPIAAIAVSLGRVTW